jgi:hypothetical protein
MASAITIASTPSGAQATTCCAMWPPKLRPKTANREHASGEDVGDGVGEPERLRGRGVPVVSQVVDGDDAIPVAQCGHLRDQA